jgi:hypothetical protein
MKRTFYLCCFSAFLRYKKNRSLELGTLALLSEIAKNAIIAGCFEQALRVSIVGAKTIHAKAAQLVTASVYYDSIEHLSMQHLPWQLSEAGRGKPYAYDSKSDRVHTQRKEVAS